MKKSLGALSALFVLVGVVGLASLASADDKPKFNAHLSGAEEVPARETMAHGHANLQLTKDGSALGFKLIVANIDNVFAAHIHCVCRRGQRAIGVTLFMGTPGGGAVTGPLADGTISAPDAGNGVRMDRSGCGPRRDRVWEHVHQRAHRRRGRPSEHGSGRLPRRGDPRQVQ